MTPRHPPTVQLSPRPRRKTLQQQPAPEQAILQTRLRQRPIPPPMQRRVQRLPQPQRPMQRPRLLLLHPLPVNLRAVPRRPLHPRCPLQPVQFWLVKRRRLQSHRLQRQRTQKMRQPPAQQPAPIRQQPLPTLRLRLRKVKRMRKLLSARHWMPLKKLSRVSSPQRLQSGNLKHGLSILRFRQRLLALARNPLRGRHQPQPPAPTTLPIWNSSPVWKPGWAKSWRVWPWPAAR